MCSTVNGSSSFHLEWNNHLGNMQSVLESLYTQQSLVDVTVACRDGVLKAHKVILSACSPYFEAVFQETPCKHPVLILKGVNVREMQALLRFMYCGQVDVPEAELSALVATACEFKVKGFAMDNMPGMDEFRPDTASEHESEGDTQNNHAKISVQNWKDHKEMEMSSGFGERLSSVNEEVDVTPVIVGSQSLLNVPSKDNSNIDNEQEEHGEHEETEEEEEEKKKKEKEEDVEKQGVSPKAPEDVSPEAEDNSNADLATSTSTPVAASSSNNLATDSQAASNSANANSGEASPYRRETRYKGQKRVDVGIRPPAGRARSVDKRETTSAGGESRGSSGYASTQNTKKPRFSARKTELSSEAEQSVPRGDLMGDKKVILGSSAMDVNISTAGSSMAEDGEGPPLPFVKIKTEIESAGEEEDDEETTADMFCISDMQELPETDSLVTSAAAEQMEVAAKWAVHPQASTASGREQRSVAEAPAEEGEGDMACPYCFTRCPRFSDLKRHMRLHTEDKPHECEFCSLAFARASHLARHRRTHTGERPFRCPVPSCERTFSRQDKLKLHTQRAHPGLPCDLVQSGTYMRIRGRRRIRDKNLPPGLRLGPANSSGGLSVASAQSAAMSGPAIISLPFGDTSYLTSLSLGQQRYSDLTISPVTTVVSSGSAARDNSSATSGAAAEELLKSVRQLGECTIQTLPSKILAE